MFSSINYLSVSIWVLGSILILATLILIIYRLLTSKKISENSDGIGKVSNKFNDFITSLVNSSEWTIIYNILCRNKFAKKNYSLIPAIIFANNKMFLLTNILSATKYQKCLVEKNSKYPVLFKGQKKVLYKDINFQFTKEISKYLRHNFPEISFQVVVPYLDSQLAINCARNMQMINVLNFEKSIQENTNDKIRISDFEIKKIVKKLAKNNLFKAKLKIDKKYLNKRGQDV